MNVTTLKKLAALTVVAAVFFALGAMPAASQTVSVPVQGKVTQEGKPLESVEVVLTSILTGKVYKTKTNKAGTFEFVGIPRGDYSVDIVSGAGDKLFTQKTSITGEGGKLDFLTIDITKDAKGGGAPKMTKEQEEKIRTENAKIGNINTLINQAQTSLNAQNWQEAEITLKQLVVMEPWRWEFFQALGNAQSNLQEYEDSAASYGKGIASAQGVVDGTGQKPPSGAAPDPVKAKAGIGQMLGSQGNVLLKVASQQTDMKLKEAKTKEAIEAFTKAAELDPNHATAYFNLCATQYNTGNMGAAEMACTKAIAADPNKADAYFIKGSAMFGNGKMDANNKWTVPDGATQALNKYLELAPDGAHANDVKQMLEAVGAKIETTYKQRKK
jgi:tetratricopeptide (TPR) repeat protein